MAVFQGQDMGALAAEQPNSRKVNINSDRTVEVAMVWRSRQDYVMAQLGGALPSVGQAAGAEIHSWYPTFVGVCVDIDIAPDIVGDDVTNSNWCTITASYAGYDTARPPFTLYELTVGRIDRPITMHPSFNNIPPDPIIFPGADNDPVNFVKIPRTQDIARGIPANIFDKFRDHLSQAEIAAGATKAALRFRGIQQYVVASLQLRITRYETQPDWSRDEVATTDTVFSAPATYIGGGVPAVEASLWMLLPDPHNHGLPSSADGREDNGNPVLNPTWIIFEKSCRNLMKNLHPLWEISRTFYFNDLGWSDEIYSRANLKRA